MKLKFSFLVALSAIAVAGCAAYYSVYGLSQLFAGASLAVIIMATSLEFSKIVTVSLLQRYWSKLSKSLKIYLTIGTFVLVCITSAGIYGFLSNAYQKTANKYEITEGQLTFLDNKKALFQKNIDDNQKLIDVKTKRVDQLTNLRNNQETRLDNASSNANANRARNDINSANKEIQTLNTEIDALNAKNSVLSDSVNAYSSKSLETKSNSSVSAEIGPLKYLAQLTGLPMDKVVNYFILLLIFVFDPLAVALVVATNKIMQLEHEGHEPDVKSHFEQMVETVKPKKPDPKPQPEDDNDDFDFDSGPIMPYATPSPVEIEPKIAFTGDSLSEMIMNQEQANFFKKQLEILDSNSEALDAWNKSIEITQPVKTIDVEAELTKILDEEITKAQVEKLQQLYAEMTKSNEQQGNSEAQEEAIPEMEPEPIVEQQIQPEASNEPVNETPHTRKIELDDIKEIKEQKKSEERIGSNKIIQDHNKDRVIFKRVQ